MQEPGLLSEPTNAMPFTPLSFDFQDICYKILQSISHCDSRLCMDCRRRRTEGQFFSMLFYLAFHARVV